MPRKPGPHAPVAAIDIDGTSGAYHPHFIWFAELWLGKELPSPTAYTGGVPFHKYLGISRDTYNKIKLAYRQGGMKRSMPVYEGIGDFTKYVRACGVQVWICTTRPYLNLSNIDPDTRAWLKRAGMQYDGLLYGPHKYHDLVRAVGRERIVIVYDDLPKMIEQATSLGLRAAMRTQPYNAGFWDSSRSLCLVSSVDDMRYRFDIAFKEWRSEHGR